MDFNFEKVLSSRSTSMSCSLGKVSRTKQFGIFVNTTLLVLGICSAPVFAASGILDTTFGTNGLVSSSLGTGNDIGYAIVRDSNGNMLERW